MKTFLKLLLFFLIILLGFAGIAFYWTFYKPLPDYDATESIDGIAQPVDIYWDTYGVPHIYAKNKQDLYYALGYVHAQDRLWQMTLTQMAGQGRFAEFLGKKMLPYDRHQRTIGFWRIAQKMEAQLPDSTRRLLQAYADGVNGYVDTHRNKLPIEFSLVGMEPIPWTVTHTLALTRMLGWELNISWWSEVTYGYLKGVLPPDKYRSLQLNYPGNAPTTLDPAQTRKLTSEVMPMLQRERKLRKLLQFDGSHVGSNAWVVDGKHTESGFPLLAGDPHLGLDMPGKWYEVHLNVNGHNLSGATTPGAPIVILGQNDFMAWSLTNIMADDTDFFAEQIDPRDRGRYVVDSLNDKAQYRRFEIQRELIKTKEGDESVFERRLTKHGPIISNIYPSDTLLHDKLVSMQWTGEQVSDEPGAMLQLNWARSFDQVKEAVQRFDVPGQNLMYADKTGNIAMFSMGKIPIRDYSPIDFRKGWDPSYDWKGYVPKEAMPHVINPDEGWIANANNKLYSDNYPYYLATFWEPPSRIERIKQYMERNKTFSPEIFKVMQNDSYSEQARQVTQLILPVLKNNNRDGRFNTVISYLENWDFKYEPSATAASIMDSFFLRLNRNTFEDEMGPEVYHDFVRLENIPVRNMDRFLKQGSPFFDDIRTDTVETRNSMIIKSMQQAEQFLADTLGSEPLQWRWGNLHTITFAPPLFSQAAEQPDASTALKLIVHNLLSKGPYAVRGHGMSVNNGQYSWVHPFTMTLGPSIRRIVDFSDLSNTQSIIPTGQSGNPLSEYFGDQTQSWLNGTYKTLYQDSTLFDTQRLHHMILKPAE